MMPIAMAITDSRKSAKSEAMIVEFRARDYATEAKAHAFPRIPADVHPLSSSPLSLEVDVMDEEKNEMLDPLREPCCSIIVTSKDSEEASIVSKAEISSSNSVELLRKEWITFKRFLVQKFPPPKMVAISTISNLVIGSHKAFEKSSNMRLDELDDPQGSADEDVKSITQQEYIARLSEMKNEVLCTWGAGDHFKSLKLSVKVARLLKDKTLVQFYPTLFTLATEILDMLGDMIWERIKRKAELLEDGTQIATLRDDFQVSEVRSNAKEICHNWFCKIGSVRDLLPRIYLELAMLPCWRFLLDDPAEVIQRLLAMMRGLGNPLASAYCHLYLVYCVQKLPSRHCGYLVTCMRDINQMMIPIASLKETTYDRNNVSKQALVHLMEPPMEYIMKCILKDHQQRCSVLVELGLERNLSELFGKRSCVSLVLHHLLKELPPEAVRSNVLHILDLIECSVGSSIDQCMNFRLLGFRLYETDAHVDKVNLVLQRVIQDALSILFQCISEGTLTVEKDHDVCGYEDLDAFLKVIDGYIDIILQNQMKNQLEMLLEGIAERACNKWINGSELESLQSILIKILIHAKCLEDVLELQCFADIIDLLRGTAKKAVNMRVLEMATSMVAWTRGQDANNYALKYASLGRNGYIICPTAIQFLFYICHGLHDSNDSSQMDSENQPLQRLLSRFVHMVDFGTQWERHLAFLVDCRATFASADEMKETLVHHANCLVTKELKYSKQLVAFGRSCLAFSDATIPSIANPVKQLFLYLETAEVALISGLVCHSDGFIDSAISSIQGLLEDLGPPLDVDGMTSILQKLCGLLVMVPGNPMLGVTYIPKSLFSLVNSLPLWIPVRLRVRTLCAMILLLATLSQHNLPYNPTRMKEVPGNNDLFFDDDSYHEELAFFCSDIIQGVILAIKQEVSPIARGSLALEACNCIASILKANDNTSHICNELLEIARSCLSTKHNYLLSTSTFVVNHLYTVTISDT